MNSKISQYLNRYVFVGAAVISILLCIFWFIILSIFYHPPVNIAGSTAIITIIPPQTITDTIPIEAQKTPTPVTGEAKLGEGINIGVYVQISGTGGDGLRMREAPGTKSKALFLGMESEVFKVDDGPKELDGYTWFHLVAPYDETRNGWAASNYLAIVAMQQ